jgi:choline dehydrogenase-like flavoprotein
VGIEGTGADGKRLRVRGKAVVLAGGAVPSPLFLMRQGLCNSSGQVGRNLTLHPSGGLAATFDEEIRGFDAIPQGYGCDEFVKEGILLTAAQPDFNYASIMFPYGGDRLMAALDDIASTAFFGLLISDDARGRVVLDYDGTAAVHYNVLQSDADRYHRAIVKMTEICWAAGAKKVMPTIFGQHTFETRADFERFKKSKLAPSELLLTSYHPLGTCKMGSDPRTSVVDLNHQAHDLPGLFVVDGSTVSGPLGVNPQLTIMAMATRAADRIADLLA